MTHRPDFPAQTNFTDCSQIRAQRQILVARSERKNDRKIGDVDMNGIVDAVDASLILTHYARISAGEKPVISEEQLVSADYNRDGTVDGRDASAVLSYYAQISVER